MKLDGQHSHSSPKYLSLKERCKEQRGHRGRKTHKLGKCGEMGCLEGCYFKMTLLLCFKEQFGITIKRKE